MAFEVDARRYGPSAYAGVPQGPVAFELVAEADARAAAAALQAGGPDAFLVSPEAAFASLLSQLSVAVAVPPQPQMQAAVYQPQEPVYYPAPQQQPAYAPQQPAYAPQQPAYALQQPAYAPQQPAYAPQQPAYAPQQPVYAPPPPPAFATEQGGWHAPRTDSGWHAPTSDAGQRPTVPQATWTTPAPTPQAQPQRQQDRPSVGTAAVELAKNYLGTPYVWGGESPHGFDCSGLMQYVYNKLGVEIPRVAKQQARAGEAVPRHDLRPGDLVYFENTDGPGITHIGMYVGDDRFIQAPHTGDVVKISNLDDPYYRAHYGGATRVA